MTAEDTPEDKKIHILKIIEKYPSIHHRELLRKILKAGLMAKATAEKYIKELEQEKQIIGHRYKKEKDYLLSAGNSTEEQLEEQFKIWLDKIKKEINKIETDYKKYSYYTKYYFVGDLETLHKRISNLHSVRLNEQVRDEMDEMQNMTEESEILDDIIKIIGDSKTDEKRVKLKDAYDAYSKIEKIKEKRVQCWRDLKITRISQKRIEIKKTKDKLDADYKEQSDKLYNIHKALKPKNEFDD